MKTVICRNITRLQTRRNEFIFLHRRGFPINVTGKSLPIKYKEIKLMNFLANNVAVKSTPKFDLILQDGDKVYYPLYALYQVQAQNQKTLKWENVSEIKKIESVNNEVIVILNSNETDIIPEMNMSRRLTIQVFYSDAGQTLSSSQVVEFQLQDIPVLSDVYEPPVPETETLVISGGRSQGLVRALAFDIDFSDPVFEIVSAEVGVWVVETSEIEYEPAEAFLLTGNQSCKVFYDNTEVASGTEVYFRLKVKTLVSQTEKTLETSLVY